MLIKCIESIIVFFINLLTGALPSSGSGRRADPVPGPSVPADRPVLIGNVIPSARDALRQTKPSPQEVRIGTEERLKHILLTGGTGAGKTTLLMNIIEDDIMAGGRGVGFIDFRGELCDRLLTRLATRYSPEDLADRLLLIDLRSPRPQQGTEKFSIGFNPLAQGNNPYSQAMFVMDVLRQQFGASLGVQTEELCRNMLLAMALSPQSLPLTDIEVFLTSLEARAALLGGIEDSSVLRFFRRYDALPEVQRNQWISPVMNKISPMLALPSLRLLLGDSQSLSLRNFLDARADAIVLICLAADEIYGAASLIGTLFVNAIGSSLMRSDRNATPFFLFLDEFQNLAAGSVDQFSVMISEARRFKLGLTLSHQSTTQLDPKLRVLTRNVISIHAIFSTGGVDADLLAGEIPSDEPKTVLKHLLLSQRPGEALLVRRGHPTVQIKTHYSPDPNVPAAAIQALRQASMRRHGRPAAEVEAELRTREALFLPGEAGVKGKPQAGTQSGPSAPTRPRKRGQAPRPASSNQQQYEVREGDNDNN